MARPQSPHIWQQGRRLSRWKALSRIHPGSQRIRPRRSLVKSRQLHALFGLHGDSGRLTEDHTDRLNRRITAIRRSDVHVLYAARAARGVGDGFAIIIVPAFVPTGLRSLSDRACRKRTPAWNGHRNARDRISRCLQRAELLRIEAQKMLLHFSFR